MILSKAEIRLLMVVLQQKTVCRPTKEFPYKITEEASWAKDADSENIPLITKLSIMLEMAE